jgi:hypothetical protein
MSLIIYIAIGIVLGFWLIGGPAEYRARRQERDRIQQAKIREWDNSERGRNIREWQREQAELIAAQPKAAPTPTPNPRHWWNPLTFLAVSFAVLCLIDAIHTFG